MYCPYLVAGKIGEFSSKDAECMRFNCALWNERFGMCSLAVDAYLKGQADIRAEKALIARNNRY